MNGCICANVNDMADRIRSLDIDPASCRSFVEANFSIARMSAGYLDVYKRATLASRSPAELGA